MICAWKELMAILPARLRHLIDIPWRNTAQEIRLRINAPGYIVHTGGRTEIDATIQLEDLNYIVNAATKYSPWIATSTYGYITAPGGHRIGLCGEACMNGNVMTGIRVLRSINIRIARDFPGISKNLLNRNGSILIIGSPGSGKTTLLRDLIRQRSQRETVAVVDERGELFPPANGFDLGVHIDVLTGCPKRLGIEMLLRTMGPDTLAVDEITAEADCYALLHAGWCGVSVLATAHAFGRNDLSSRSVYQPLLRSGLFTHLVIMDRDKSWRVERMGL